MTADPIVCQEGLDVRPSRVPILTSFAVLAALIQSPQLKAESPGAPLAREAQRVLKENCAETTSQRLEDVRQDLTVVADVWSRLSESYDKDGEVLLLYWRGVLSWCMSQDLRAAQDLREFLEREPGLSQHRAWVEDAERRLRILDGKYPEMKRDVEPKKKVQPEKTKPK